MGKHDHSYKHLFAHKRMVKDLIEGFIQEPLVKRLDFSTLEHCNGSYVSDDLREREDDMVWRVRCGKNKWVYVYVLLEFQSTVDWFMAIRVMAYIYLLYQDLIKSKKMKKGQKLPIVLPIVLYNGDKEWTAPVRVRDLIESVPGEMARFRSPLEYLLLEERRYPKKDLKAGPNLVSLLFRLAQSADAGEICKVLDEFTPWLETTEIEDVKRSFLLWIKRVVLADKSDDDQPQKELSLQEVQSMLAERLKKRDQQLAARIRRKALAEGKKKGIEKGREEGLRVGIIAALEARFQRIPSSLEHDIHSVSNMDTLKELHRQAVIAKSVKAFQKIMVS